MYFHILDGEAHEVTWRRTDLRRDEVQEIWDAETNEGLRVYQTKQPHYEALLNIRNAAAGTRQVGTDVTHKFAKNRKGGTSVTSIETAANGGSRDNSVFLVHGRNLAAARQLRTFFNALGIYVIDWERAVSLTGEGSPCIANIIEAGLTNATAAVILFTPDEDVKLKPNLASPTDPKQPESQARPNVYYEAGLADAYARSRTIFIEMGDVRSFSDIAGRHVVRFDDSSQSRVVLTQRLRNCGLVPDMSGTQWLE